MELENVLDDEMCKAVKKLATGMIVTEVTKEFVSTDEGEMQLVKQKVNEKMLPPNTDIVKLLYSMNKEPTNDYSAMSDDELEHERIRLLNELKKETKEDDNRENKHES